MDPNSYEALLRRLDSGSNGACIQSGFPSRMCFEPKTTVPEWRGFRGFPSVQDTEMDRIATFARVSDAL